jgi:hypothetical protein
MERSTIKNMKNMKNVKRSQVVFCLIDLLRKMPDYVSYASYVVNFHTSG